MQPLIRISDYVDEYLNLTYEVYAHNGNIINVTYYQLNKDETVYDPTFKETYRKSGKLSGRKWNKIHLVPVMFSQNTSHGFTSGEKGFSFNQETQTDIVIEANIGLHPHIGDIILFNINKDYSFWEIENIEKSGSVKNAFYKCNLKSIRLENPSFENAISAEFIFIEYIKKILKLEDGTKFSKLMDRLNQCISKLNSKYFNHNIAAHVQDNKCFIELELMLSIHDSIKPPTEILLCDSYNIDVIQNSIITLLCAPLLYKGDILLYHFNKSDINPRLKIFGNIDEYMFDTNGKYDIIYNFYPEDYNNILNFLHLYNDYILKIRKKLIYDEDIFSNSLIKLLLEHVKFSINNFETDLNYSLIGSNLLELVIEYCLVSRMLIAIDTLGVELI